MAAGTRGAKKANSRDTKRVRITVNTPGRNCVCFKDAAATQDDVLGSHRRNRTRGKVEVLLDYR